MSLSLPFSPGSGVDIVVDNYLTTSSKLKE
jgi:hypothetical protein